MNNRVSNILIINILFCYFICNGVIKNTFINYNKNFATCVQNNPNPIIKSNEKSDTITANVVLVKEYEIGKNPYFPKNDKKMNSAFPQSIFYQNDELFMFNFWGELNIYNFKTKKTERLDRISKFMHDSFYNEHAGTTGFYVKGDSIFIGARRFIYVFSRSNENTFKVFPQFDHNISNYVVFSDHSIYVFDHEGFFQLQGYNKKQLYVENEEVAWEILILYNDTLALTNGYGSSQALYIYTKNFSKLIGELKFDFKEDEITLISASSKQFTWIGEKEKGLWIYNKYSKNKYFVKFDKNFLAYPRDVPIEDYADGIRVAQKSDKNFYFVIMKNNKVQIYEVSW